MSRSQARRSVAVALGLLVVLSAVPATVAGVAADGSPAVTPDGDRPSVPDDRFEAAAAAGVSFDQHRMGNVFLANQTVRIGVESDAGRVVWVLEEYGGRRVANGTLAVDGETTLELPVEEPGYK